MSWLTSMWEKVTSKLGAVASYIPIIADLIKVKLDEGDVDAVRSHAHELKEAAEALANAADVILMATEDGSISLTEGSQIALALEEAVDQFEDVYKGVDEDDPVE